MYIPIFNTHCCRCYKNLKPNTVQSANSAIAVFNLKPNTVQSANSAIAVFNLKPNTVQSAISVIAVFNLKPNTVQSANSFYSSIQLFSMHLYIKLIYITVIPVIF